MNNEYLCFNLIYHILLYLLLYYIYLVYFILKFFNFSDFSSWLSLLMGFTLLVNIYKLK